MAKNSAEIRVRMRSLWNGLAGVHSKYYQAALNGNFPLVLTYKAEGEVMTIPANKVKDIHSRSKETFRDRFKGEPYFLVYYKWKPDAAELSLF